MGDIFNDRQVVVMREKKYPGSHTSGWMLRIIDVISMREGARNSFWRYLHQVFSEE